MRATPAAEMAPGAPGVERHLHGKRPGDLPYDLRLLL